VTARAALVLAAAGLASCAPKGGGRGGFGGFAVPVEVAEVRTQTVRDAFRAVGTVEADENVRVVAEVAASVRALPFVEGQPVARGATLAQLDDREFRAESQRADAEHQLANANFERARKLFDQNAISQRELDDAHAALSVAEANASLARVKLEKSCIRAPFDGVVGQRLVSVGAYLNVGDAVVEMANLSMLKVTFAAPERMLSELKSGHEVSVSVPAFPAETFTGRVTVVNPIIDPDQRTVRLTARLPNPGRRLRPGMSANVTVSLAERAKALTVPDEAVFAEGDQLFVYVVKADSSVARAAIRIGTRDSSRVEVLSGLASGDRVVAAGHQKLYPGAKVMPVGMESAAGAAPPGAATAGGGKAKGKS
jgi:membrane fusion protein (multidrug efflux system)